PDRNPPPTIGLLVNAPWLAEHHATDAREVEWLVRECGYCEDPITDDVIEMLSLGLSFVVPQMSRNGPADKWVERARSLSWQLSAARADVAATDGGSIDLNDPIDAALFLSAVRDTDRLLFAAGRAGIPAELSRNRANVLAVCFHASSRH